MTACHLPSRIRSTVNQRVVTLGLSIALLLSMSLAARAAESAAAVEQRLSEAAAYLASDELEGRGVGTKGLELAAEYLHEQFRQIGLKTDLIDGQPFQSFEIATGARLGQENSLTFMGPPDASGRPQRIELKLSTDFNPMAIGGSDRFHLPVVFAGYGITGRKEQYDDYAHVDVKGKAVIILRHEPQQNNPHSAFEGTETSRHATFRSKVSNAYQHGAAAVIFVTDQVEIERRVHAVQRRLETAIDELAQAHAEFKKTEAPTLEQMAAFQRKIKTLAEDVERYSQQAQQEIDPVLDFQRAGEDAEGREMPVLHCRRGVLDPIVQAALGKDLATLEKEIDNGPTPQSAELAGWRVLGQTSIDRDRTMIKNVIAVLEGDGPQADETIVIGAHYDHLGRGDVGSAMPGSTEIHNGADDNASGTAVLLEIARALANRSEKLPRRVVFIAFTGEERGLLGSAHYIRQPLFPLDKTVAMLNMDMVGRLQDNKLIVNGTGTAKEFDAWLDTLNHATKFELIKKPTGFGPSDHASFYAKQIPVLHFFTGSHQDYHRPSDTHEKLDINGMRRVGELVTALTEQIALADSRPQYQDTPEPAVAMRGGSRPYFGSIPDFSNTTPGYALSGVAKGSPAERAGIRGGDVVIQFGDSKIGNLEDIDGALRKYTAGEKVPVVVKRGDKELTLEVILDPPR